MEQDWLEEQIKTTRNLCEVALVLIRNGRHELLPTVLELLYQETQQIVDENCVVKE